MSIDARLNKLMPVLSAKERAILVLESWKAGEEEDPLWRSTMPSSQLSEFNRYIDLMNAANVRLGHLVLVIEKEVEKLQLYEAWLYTLLVWQVNLAEIDWLASVVAREAVTETEHKKLLKQAEAEYVSIETAASMVAEHRREWKDEDLETTALSQELKVRTEAWARLCQKAEQQLRKAAAAGELDARGAGKAMRIRHISLDVWLGREVTLYPQWAGGYEVLPDQESGRVETDRHTLANLQQAIREVPLARLVQEERADEDGSVGGLMEVIGRKLAGGLALRWMELRSAEMMAEIIQGEFDDIDPLKPKVRAAVEANRAAIEQMVRISERHGRPVELLDPGENEIAEMKSFLEGDGRLFK